MTGKKSNIAMKIGRRIKQKDPGAEVILFGSHARGQAHDEFDWDILILIDNQEPGRSKEELYRDEVFQVELEVGEPISTYIVSKSDWENKQKYSPLYVNIKREGIVVS